MDRTDAIVLGRKIGTFEDWNDLETNAMVLYGFEPADGVKLPSGDVNVLYDDGLFEVCNDDGDVEFSADIAAVVMALPIHDRN